MSQENLEQQNTEEKKPNIIWSSERVYKQVTKVDDKEKVSWFSKPTDDDKEGRPKYGDPPKSPVIIGNVEFVVPSAEVQLKGFYSPAVFRLTRQVNGYKKFVPKG